MSTITKEWLKQKIAEMEAARDEIPFGLGEDGTNTLAALRIALASLEAVPVAYMTYKGYLLHAADPKLAEYSEPTPLYDAPPAPVALPSGYSDFEEIWSSSTHPLTQDDEMKDFAWDIWNACRAAMFQGVENAETPTTMQAAPALDSSPKIAELPSGNSPVIPDGWVLVPEEPTHEMLEAGDEQFGTYDVYRRMIEAAPKLE